MLTFVQKLSDSVPGGHYELTTRRYDRCRGMWFSVTGPGLPPDHNNGDKRWELYSSNGEIRVPTGEGNEHNKLLSDFLSDYLIKDVPKIKNKSIPG